MKAQRVEVEKPLPKVLKQYTRTSIEGLYCRAPESPTVKTTDWRSFEGVREP